MHTKQFYFLFVNLLFSFFGYCQLSNGIIEYRVILEISNNKSKNVTTAKMIDEIEKKSNNLNFLLKISDDNKTSFCLEEKLKTGINEGEELIKKLALLRICPYGYFYDFTNFNSILEATDGTLIKNEISKSNWQLINETKMIDKFLCFKAISTKTIINRNGEKKNIEIIAWYSPSIPLPYGPKDYFGLPGLILEIQERNFTLVASSITFSDKKVKIDIPEGNTITQEEYEHRVLSRN